MTSLKTRNSKMAAGAEYLKTPQVPEKFREVIGFWGTKLKVKDEEPEIITIGGDKSASKGQDGKNSTRGGSRNGQNKVSTSAVAGRVKPGSTPSATPNSTVGPATPWSDKLLRKLVQKGKWKKTAWLPGSGRHLDEGRNSYEPFTHIVRTLHLIDAFDVLTSNRIKPRELVTFSSLQSRLLPNDHPCKNLKVLWFSARSASEEEEDPNWYGNVEFAVPCSLLLEMFRNCFLVEILTTPTHSVSRVLLTNADYSSVLPRYNSEQPGGGWKVDQQGHHFALRKCSRYRFQGMNMFDHVLEFMLEVTAEDEKKLLSNCEIDFKNHEDAKDITQAHVCNRYQRLKQACPTPFTPAETAVAFRSGLKERKVNWKKISLKLTEHAKRCLQEVEVNKIDSPEAAA